MGLFGKKNKEKAKEVKIGKKVGLCLGGGGLRGFAHIGALKALEEEGFIFDLIVGTSAGSIVGALYASGMHPDEMMIYTESIDLKDVKKGFLLTPSDSLKIGKVVTDFIGDINIEDLKKQFCCVAVDLVEAKQVILDKGSVGLAVSASCAVPMAFKPVVRGKQHLVDGGVLNNIPADICRMLGADHVVTIDVNPTRGGGSPELGLLEVLKATFNIMSATASIEGLRQSDVVIAPNLSKFKATAKDGYKEMIELAYLEAKKHIPKIKTLF